MISWITVFLQIMIWINKINNENYIQLTGWNYRYKVQHYLDIIWLEIILIAIATYGI